jgi:hypothetical protein
MNVRIATTTCITIFYNYYYRYYSYGFIIYRIQIETLTQADAICRLLLVR